MDNKLHKVVLPFFVYAALAFFVAMVLIASHTYSFLGFYFEPHVLAITHVLAIGWATMIIIGACYQLIPFLNRVPLYSSRIAYCSFGLLAVGIPLLVCRFISFNFDMISLFGAGMINCAFFCFLFVIFKTVSSQKVLNIHSVYIVVSTIWLVLTAVVGFVLILNFNYSFLSQNSIAYLSFHAHIGVVGWFLLLIIGVSSRLFPMFLMSEYSNDVLLKRILLLVNAGLICYLIGFLFFNERQFEIISMICIGFSLAAYIYYCINVYNTRLKKSIAPLFNLSSISMLFLIISLGNICMLIFSKQAVNSPQLILTYGSFIFLGWVSTLILSMTFKIVPFIIWTMYKSYENQHTNFLPVDLYSKKLIHIMNAIYLFGIGLFFLGIILSENFLIKYSSRLLLFAAILYNYNVLKMFFYKPTYYETNK